MFFHLCSTPKYVLSPLFKSNKTTIKSPYSLNKNSIILIIQLPFMQTNFCMAHKIRKMFMNSWVLCLFALEESILKSFRDLIHFLFDSNYLDLKCFIFKKFSVKPKVVSNSLVTKHF